MRICLLTNQDIDADPFPEDDWPCDPRPFMPEADWHVEVLERDTAVQRIVHLAREGFDLFFNLCDGALDEASPGVEVIRALERLKLPFTGASSTFYEPTREAMKHACVSKGIDFPAYVMATCEADVARAAETLRFPLIVKHPSSYASIDLTEESRVTTAEALHEMAAIMILKHTAALIEEFIEGDEATVLVVENASDPLEPVAFTPVRYVFPEGQSFKHHDLKWEDYDAMQCHPVESAELAERLRRVSRDFFVALNGRGFGRVDMRIDADGRIFVLEMNPNCGVYYPASDAGSADLCLLHDPAGHEGFTRHLVAAAQANHRRDHPPFRVTSSATHGFGMVATRRVPAGGCILAHTEHATRLVRGGEGVRDEWFRRTAWPLTDELWLAWSLDPEEWRPVNHSCEPNAWIEGLDLVARTDIAEGEEITLDYATVFNEHMLDFNCACERPSCRRVIRGSDFREPLVERYGAHVSDFVRRRRAALIADSDGSVRQPSPTPAATHD